ncbi:MAG: dTMP kinase [Clostridiales bacterium]|nr:dTMP kinase [Clostridiales bacterium]
MSGLFITMEGTDGSGKTTQSELLRDYLEEKGFSVLYTREPGGNQISEKIRDIIIDTKNKKMNPRAEALLYAAARAQLVSEVIIPTLKKGDIVICDRFADSSVAYQGEGRKLGSEVISGLNLFATDGLEPDITFFLKIDPEESIERKKRQESLDRIELEKIYFHKKVFYGYISLAEKFSERIKIIDASADINTIHQNITAYIEELLSRRSF